MGSTKQPLKNLSPETLFNAFQRGEIDEDALSSDQLIELVTQLRVNLAAAKTARSQMKEFDDLAQRVQSAGKKFSM